MTELPPLRDRVVVIGAGPVGQTAALALARWGVPVVLVDQRPARDAVGSKAICQQRDVLDFWAALGAGAITDEGLTWSRARTFYRDQELFCVDLPDPGRSPLPPFVNISQSRTERILDEVIAAQPLIEVRWGREVVAVEERPDGLVVRCATSSGDETIEAAYAVACAGARGASLRELLQVDFEGRTFDDAFLICDIEARLPGWEQERRFYFDPVWNPGRQVLIHPCPDGLYRIDWQVDPDFDLDAEQAAGRLDTRIRQVIGDQPYRLDWTSVYRFHARVASRFRVGRVLLAGDMAHLVSPFGARGLNSGVPDAENAAWKIAFALRGWAGPGLLDTYELERRAAAAENLEVTSATMDFLVPHSPEAAAQRATLLEAARTDPAARAQVDSGRLAEAFWYVDSPLTTGAAERPWQGRPPRGQVPAPVPGVIVPDVPVHVEGRPDVTRLRELARGGLLALAGPAVDLEATRRALAEGAGEVPHAVLAMDAMEPSGILAASLATRPGEVWLVRPDAHTCAVVTEPSALTRAARRALGH
jgi:pentachlorophenol monooxygenase/3-(3-hydroxy-phenyl)propionate hydroxylase